VLVVIVAGLIAWCLTTSPPPIRVAKKGGYTDVRLYHDIAAQVAKGRSFYAATAELHRAHHYPLKPSSPCASRPRWSLPRISDGWRSGYFCMATLFIATFLWVLGTEGKLHIVERIALLGAMGAGGGQVVQPNAGAPGISGGECIGLALALWIGWPRKWWLPMIPVLLGLFIRELVLPFAGAGLCGGRAAVARGDRMDRGADDLGFLHGLARGAGERGAASQ
jgi:hypothetical protein